MLLSWPRIIAAALVVTYLSGCSTLRLAYWQAPQLLFWWIDAHVDLDEVQAAQVRTDIDGLAAWHRAEELPRLARLLHHWQELAPHDLDAGTVCRQYEAWYDAWGRLAARAGPSLAALALGLGEAQLAHLQRHQHKQRDNFVREFLDGTPEQRLRRRVARALERYERLYGPLDATQRSLVRDGLARSPFDPEAALRRREERDAALLALVRRWQAMPAASDARLALAATEATAWLRDALPPAGDAPHPLAATLRHGCASLATVHNATSAAQRAHAVQVLRAYEADLNALARPSGG